MSLLNGKSGLVPKTRFALAPVGILALFWIGFAQTYSSGQFLLSPAGVRQTGLAGAGSAGNDATGILATNPASAAASPERFLHAEETREFPDTRSDLLQALVRRGDNSLGLSLQYRLDGNIIFADEEGHYDSAANFGWQNLLAAFHYGRAVGPWSLGVGVKTFRETVIDDSRDGAALDLGARAAIGPNTAVGLAVQNLGRSGSFLAGPAERLPLLVKAGIQQRHTHGKLTVEGLADVIGLVHERTWWAPLAVEISYGNRIFVRGGYPLHRGEARPAIGAGVRYKNLQIDYALTVAGNDFESNHALGLTFWSF